MQIASLKNTGAHESANRGWGFGVLYDCLEPRRRCGKTNVTGGSKADYYLMLLDSSVGQQALRELAILPAADKGV